jgi:two-component system LytT family response regulator
MSNYKTIIVEDNPDNAAVLRKIITKNHPDLQIVAEANSVESAKEVILTYEPDIALMDIELTLGTSFDVLAALKKIRPISFEIIFITAHHRYDYTTQAIDFSALAFISKPVDPQILRGAIEKAKEKQSKEIQIDQLLSKLQALDKHYTQIIIPLANNNKKIESIANITYFEADGQTSIVHFQNGTTLRAFRILGHFKKMLMNNYPFFLIHNSLLVNVGQVKSFKYKASKSAQTDDFAEFPKAKELEITLKNGQTLIASRRFGKDFIKYWEEFHSSKGSLWDRVKAYLNKKSY